MTLGIMQPYFFPYLGYYDVINQSDAWIVFDVVLYKPKSWMNRNRILHPSEGWQYISVPVAHASTDAIKDVRVIDKAAAQRRILGQIEHYRARRAPFFSAVRALIEKAFAAAGDALADLNVASLAVVCEYIGIPFEPKKLSEMGLSLPKIEDPGDWALEICAALGFDGYVNPPGGRDIFDVGRYARRGISIRFTDLVDFRYSQRAASFVEHLSVLDVLMWNPPESVRAYLSERKRSSATSRPGEA